MSSPSLAAADWSRIAASIAEDGWVRLSRVLMPEAVVRLCDADRPPWHDLPPEEGVVHQNGFGSWLAFADCAQEVRQVGIDLVSTLSAAAESQGLPGLPRFNEAEWTYYPEGNGHITAHRDPRAYGGIIAVFTLFGSASFQIGTSGTETRWLTKSGDAVILRGNGWPTREARCPVHAAGAPVGGDRMVMTMRCNSRGPGGGYDI